MKYHRDSLYAHPTHNRPMDRNQRCRWAYKLNVLRETNRITPADHDVAVSLLKDLGDDGRCDPTRQRIAKRSLCSVRTVARSLNRLEQRGMVHRTRRITRTRDGARQTSSAYRLDETALSSAPRPGGHPGPGIRKDRLSLSTLAAIPRPEHDPAALARQREAGQLRFLKERMLRRESKQGT